MDNIFAALLNSSAPTPRPAKFASLAVDVASVAADAAEPVSPQRLETPRIVEVENTLEKMVDGDAPDDTAAGNGAAGNNGNKRAVWVPSGEIGSNSPA